MKNLKNIFGWITLVTFVTFGTTFVKADGITITGQPEQSIESVPCSNIVDKTGITITGLTIIGITITGLTGITITGITEVLTADETDGKACNIV